MEPNPDGTIPPHQPNCFGCGPDNPNGLHLRMRVHGDRVLADYRFEKRFEGSPGIAHGGAVASLLDDLFGGVLVMLGQPAVTARLSVDYRAPVFLDRPLHLQGWSAGSTGRKLNLQATLHDGDRLLAEASALFLTVAIEHFDAAGHPLPPAWRTWSTSGSAPPA